MFPSPASKSEPRNQEEKGGKKSELLMGKPGHDIGQEGTLRTNGTIKFTL
jgi:hypothetical protein